MSHFINGMTPFPALTGDIQMADNGKQTLTRPSFAPWLGLSENIRQPRYEIEPLPDSVGEGFRLRLFVLDATKTKEVEIGRQIFTPRDGFNNSQIYQEASEAGVSWLSTYECLQ
jgi:hypothetical protein